jgi:hypothetical protein
VFLGICCLFISRILASSDIKNSKIGLPSMLVANLSYFGQKVFKRQPPFFKKGFKKKKRIHKKCIGTIITTTNYNFAEIFDNVFQNSLKLFKNFRHPKCIWKIKTSIARCELTNIFRMIFGLNMILVNFYLLRQYSHHFSFCGATETFECLFCIEHAPNLGEGPGLFMVI